MLSSFGFKPLKQNPTFAVVRGRDKDINKLKIKI